jgi:signal transduction histidine kinase
MRFGLTGRMAVAGGLLILVVAFTFAVLIFAILGMRDSADLARRSRAELTEVGQLETLLVDMETGLRGFVITRENRFLEPWRVGRETFPRQAAELAASNDDATQSARLVAIAEAGRSYIEDYGIPLVARVRRGDASASSVTVTEQGKRRVDALRQQLTELTVAERALLTARQDAADADARRAIVVAFFGLALSVVLTLFLTGYMTRTIVRPVTRAAALARRLASGELTARMPETGIGEVGALERSFNTMAGSLDTSQRELRGLVEQQSALRRVATLVARGVPSEDLFEAVIREVGLLSGADLARMERYETDLTVTGVAAWSRERRTLAVGSRIALEGVSIAALVRDAGRPVRIDSFAEAAGPIAEEARALGIRSSVGCPIFVAGRLWGVIAASTRNEEPFPTDTESQIGEFTELLATAIANAESRAEVAASRARIVAASDETRRRIERDLHDGAQQRLVSLGLELRATEPSLPPEVRAGVGRVADELDGVVDDLREISRGIHPAIVSEGGLGPALRTLARRSAVPVDLDLRTEQRFPEPVEVAAYYVAAEALTNTAKHAHAAKAHVALETRDEVLRVAIHDDGAGGADPAHGSGLVGLRDRVEALGGRLEVASPRGEGTTLVVELPLALRRS